MTETLTRREQEIGLILTDLFWTSMVEPKPYKRTIDSESANRLVLGMLVNRGVGYERAIRYPDALAARIGTENIVEGILGISHERLTEIICEAPALHRFTKTMSKVTRAFAERTKTVYAGNAARIWTTDQPYTGEMLEARFREYVGAGQKISSLLVRVTVLESYAVPLDGLATCDISADRHSIRVFHRLGLTEAEDAQATILAARRLLPENPCVADSSWLVGLSNCSVSLPKCGSCQFGSLCERGKRADVGELIAAYGEGRF